MANGFEFENTILRKPQKTSEIGSPIGLLTKNIQTLGFVNTNFNTPDAKGSINHSSNSADAQRKLFSGIKLETPINLTKTKNDPLKCINPACLNPKAYIDGFYEEVCSINCSKQMSIKFSI